MVYIQKFRKSENLLDTGLMKSESAPEISIGLDMGWTGSGQ